MDLLRLPYLPLIEVFKNMEFREKFLISFMSKRAKNTINITCVKPLFLFEFSDSLGIHCEQRPSKSEMTVSTEGDYLIGGEVMKLSLSSDAVLLRNQTVQNQLLLASYVLDTFRKSTVSVEFSDPTLPSSVLEFINMIHQRQLSIKSLDYKITEEFVSEILDKCTEVTDFISIHSVFPTGFVYTPPRPFKAKEFRVVHRTNWFDMESFMSCRCIKVYFGGKSRRTEQTYNSFFSKWMGSDIPLQKMLLSSDKDLENQMIMNALSNLGTKRRLEEGWIEIKREDGSELYIIKSIIGIEIHKKQSYLEKLKEIVERKNMARKMRLIRRTLNNQLARLRQFQNRQAN
uniref:F-box domain-containing protein n=1 Tax=Caenorhabditis tropicalis TaxID=1561998 RepID=A0A1I7UTR8_9PELO